MIGHWKLDACMVSGVRVNIAQHVLTQPNWVGGSHRQVSRVCSPCPRRPWPERCFASIVALRVVCCCMNCIRLDMDWYLLLICMCCR